MLLHRTLLFYFKPIEAYFTKKEKGKKSPFPFLILHGLTILRLGADDVPSCARIGFCWSIISS